MHSFFARLLLIADSLLLIPYRRPSLSLHHSFKHLEEFWKGDLRGISTVDKGLSTSSQRSDGEGHGEPVAVLGIDFSAMQLLAAGNREPVFMFLDLGSHGAQVSRDCGDAVGLLYPQLAGLAHHQAILRVRSDGRQHRN